MKKVIFCLGFLFLMGCQNRPAPVFHKQASEKEYDPELTLEDHVRLVLDPEFQDWVLFENGTYLIFFNADTIPDLKETAIAIMKESGPVYPGGPSGDFGVMHFEQAEDWVVSYEHRGMYTYVHPREIGNPDPNDFEIGVYGRRKRDKDGKNPVVLHVNRKENQSVN